ncbi:pyridoxal 5'-phosphate synthase glutaminase subunit PdxT [uncultured Microbacterium sp.]|uniref:pyridoxal 5'-phosphate synthase glutaminase subunit PdxT n=1 Tax=uncultured Microbacterium sp. TaxID=191216 RepID=UPI0026238A1D|nr:pyridoxal 5'-phosphate synthase glutaminase subunit PdxT [uncultured Microbacterium sp.]
MTMIGVLALQGDVREHERMLSALGAETIRVRRPEDLVQVDGLVIPGGESTVIDKLSRQFGMQHPIRAAIADGMPVLGTCAGLIMLADAVADGVDGQETIGGLDVVVRRNAFGRQAESFEAALDVAGFDERPVDAAFIRGPVIESVGPRAGTIAMLDDGRAVAVVQGSIVGLAFHPEISGEHRFHERLITDAAQYRARSR